MGERRETAKGFPHSHPVLVELLNAAHQTLDYGIVNFDIPQRSLTRTNGFHAASAIQ
jgi:hypothetical protein